AGRCGGGGYRAPEAPAVSTASTRYPGGSERWRNEIAGRQYAAASDGSLVDRARLHASGDRFHEHASPNAITATGHGRHRRSDSVSAAIGIAAKRRRATFAPMPAGTE